MPNQITIGMLAIDAASHRGFKVDLPRHDRYTFSYFYNPIVLLDRNGLREWPPGASIIHAPEEPRYISAEQSDLLNSWFQFSGDGVVECLEKYGIPLRTVMELGEVSFLKPILEEIRYERAQKPLFWEDAVSDLARQFFRELGALIRDLSIVATPGQQKTTRLLHDIRARVHSDISHRWTVPEMAALGKMHPTWFSSLYKQQFGSSPMDDLLDTRLRHATYLLSHLPLPISRISSDCGFTSVEHFTRLFRKRLGKSPGEVRKASS